jgi:predicted enzyme related to lactoylglutathione lyase
MMAATGGNAVGWFRALVIDADDPEGLAEFWCAVLGVEVVRSQPDWVQLSVGRGGAFMAFQPASDDRPAGMRARPDIEVADVEAARRDVEGLGGTHVRTMHEDEGGTHEMMADPEGNEFCLVGPLPEGERRHWPVDGDG